MAAQSIRSVAVFCGSSNGLERAWIEDAAAFGRLLARSGVRLVYGGGALGLMGACARAVMGEGGRVLGVIPEFLRQAEVAYEAVELVMVGSMHERKATMYQEADGFVVMPGGVGTLEEAVEIMSWVRLGLHAKPVVFLNTHGYWDSLLDFFEHSVRQGFTPPGFRDAFAVVREIADILPKLEAMAEKAGERPPMPLTVT
jgi:uncharacterized protein (TIGR00730 family)